MNIFLKFVYVFLVTILYSFSFIQATLVMQPQSVLNKIVKTEAYAHKLLMPTYARKALPIIVAQADTNISIITQKVALEKIKNDLIEFFDLSWDNYALISFSIGYDSYEQFLNSFKPLTVDGVKIKAHHIRSLTRSTQKLLTDLTEYIQYVRFMGHSDIQINALLVLEGLCQQLLQDFLKEGYFLPSTTAEIFTDLLVYRTTEMMMKHKAITACLALIIWEFIGRKFDPEHKNSYSQPLTILKELFIKKAQEELKDPSKNKDLSNIDNDNFGDMPLTQQQKDDLTRDLDTIQAPKTFNGGSRVDVKFTDLIPVADPQLRDKNNKLIPLSSQQACSRVAIDGEKENGKALYVVTDSGEERIGLRITKQETFILTPGQAGKDFKVEYNIPVPAQKDGYSCGPRALWAAERLLNAQRKDKQEEQGIDSFIREVYTALDGSRTILHDEHLLKFAKTRPVLNNALQSKELLILGSRSKNQVLQDYYSGKYMKKKDRQLAEVNGQDIPLMDAITEFQKGERPQVIALLVGQHWITIKLELKVIDGTTKLAMSCCDGFGSNYANHPSLLAVLYAFTEGTSYQVGKIEKPQEYQWSVLEHLNGTCQTSEEKAFIDQAIANKVLFLTDKGLAPLSYELIANKVEKDKAEVIRLKKLNLNRSNSLMLAS